MFLRGFAGSSGRLDEFVFRLQRVDSDVPRLLQDGGGQEPDRGVSGPHHQLRQRHSDSHLPEAPGQNALSICNPITHSGTPTALAALALLYDVSVRL